MRDGKSEPDQKHRVPNFKENVVLVQHQATYINGRTNGSFEIPI